MRCTENSRCFEATQVWLPLLDAAGPHTGFTQVEGKQTYTVTPLIISHTPSPHLTLGTVCHSHNKSSQSLSVGAHSFLWQPRECGFLAIGMSLYISMVSLACLVAAALSLSPGIILPAAYVLPCITLSHSCLLLLHNHSSLQTHSCNNILHITLQ